HRRSEDRVGQARCDGARRAPGLTRALEAKPTRQATGRAWRARTIRAATLAAVNGVSVTHAPKGASASSTALAMAAGGEIAPPPPRPLTPSGLRGEGYSRCTVSIGGRSSALGTA